MAVAEGDVKLTFRGWLDTRTIPFPGEPDRVCDTVAELADENPEPVSVALVTEFQMEPEARAGKGTGIVFG